MSYDFHVACDEPPTKEEVAAGSGAVCTSAGKSPDGDWASGPLQLWIPGHSTRRTAVSLARGEFTIEIFRGATAEDHALASGMAEWLAVRCGQDVIDADFFGPVPLAEFPIKFGRDWAVTSEKSGFEDLIRFASDGALLQAIGQPPDAPVALSGPMGQFHLGPRLIKALQGIDDETELWLKLKRCMLDFHDPAVHHAPVLNFGGRPGEKPPNCVIWCADKTEVVSKADFVILGATPPAPISWAGFLELAAGRLIRLVDEDQPLVRACEPHELPALISQARAIDKSSELKAKSAVPRRRFNPLANSKVTFIGKLGMGIGILLFVTAAFRFLEASGSDEYVTPMLFGLGFIVISFLGARKPIKRR
jgi:hypothetical protein